MKRFRVVGHVTISVSTVVEATSKAAAKREALGERAVMSLCHQCASGHDENVEWVTSGELDGEVKVVDVEEDA